MKRRVNRKHKKIIMIALAGALSVSLVSTSVVALDKTDVESIESEITRIEEFENSSMKVKCFVRDNDGPITVDIIVNDELVDTVSKEEIDALFDSGETVILGKEKIALPFLERAYYNAIGRQNLSYWKDETDLEIYNDAFSNNISICVSGTIVQKFDRNDFIKFINEHLNEEKIYMSTKLGAIEFNLVDLKRALYITEGKVSRSDDLNVNFHLLSIILTMCFISMCFTAYELRDIDYGNILKKRKH